MLGKFPPDILAILHDVSFRKPRGN